MHHCLCEYIHCPAPRPLPLRVPDTWLGQMGTPQHRGQLRHHLLMRCLACVVAALAAVALSKVEAKRLLFDIISVAQEWKADQPLATAACAIGVVALWILSFMPLTPLEVSLGFLFGVRVGYVVVFAGKVLGCTASFALGRTVAHDWAQRQFGKHELLRAVDLAVARQPYKICFIVRLAYIPIALKNFGLAVLSVRPEVFIASLVGVELFNSSVLVTVGSTAKDLGALISGKEPKSPGQLAVMVLGCGFLVGLLAYLSVFTQRALQEVRAEQGMERRNKLVAQSSEGSKAGEAAAPASPAASPVSTVAD